MFYACWKPELIWVPTTSVREAKLARHSRSTVGSFAPLLAAQTKADGSTVANYLWAGNTGIREGGCWINNDSEPTLEKKTPFRICAASPNCCFAFPTRHTRSAGPIRLCPDGGSGPRCLGQLPLVCFPRVSNSRPKYLGHATLPRATLSYECNETRALSGEQLCRVKSVTTAISTNTGVDRSPPEAGTAGVTLNSDAKPRG